LLSKQNHFLEVRRGRPSRAQVGARRRAELVPDEHAGPVAPEFFIIAAVAQKLRVRGDKFALRLYCQPAETMGGRLADSKDFYRDSTREIGAYHMVCILAKEFRKRRREVYLLPTQKDLNRFWRDSD
jgi:hypothetical protein